MEWPLNRLGSDGKTPWLMRIKAIKMRFRSNTESVIKDFVDSAWYL